MNKSDPIKDAVVPDGTGITFYFNAVNTPELAETIKQIAELETRKLELIKSAKKTAEASTMAGIIRGITGRSPGNLFGTYSDHFKYDHSNYAFTIRCSANSLVVDPALKYDVKLDPSTVNQLLSAKLLNDDEKRKLLAHQYPSIFGNTEHKSSSSEFRFTTDIDDDVLGSLGE